jgi:hypothetical protein
MADPVAPTEAELTIALRYLTLDRLEPLLRSYLDFARTSSQPKIDASAILARLPKGAYFLEIKENAPDCELISETGRLFRLQQLLGIFFLLALIGGPLAASYFLSIADFFLISFLCWGSMLAVTLAGCLVIDSIRRKQDRIVCSIPTELHQTLLNVRSELRAKQKSLVGITIIAQLAGKLILGPIADVSGGEETGKFLAQLMEFISEKVGERLIENRIELLREDILARFAPPVIPAGMSAPDSIERYANFLYQRSSFVETMSRLPPYAVAQATIWAGPAMQQILNNRSGRTEEESRGGD